MAQDSLTPYQYIWRDYSQPHYQSLILTVNSYQALSLLAFLSAFIAYVQTRCWIITRHLLIRILRPIQLPDSDGATSLNHLSQAKAVKSLIFKKMRRDSDSMVSISPWFGAASLFNVLLFIFLGTIIPYYLAGGSGPAQVQAQLTGACDGFESRSAGAAQQAQSFYTQCRLNGSADANTCGYVTRIVDSRPQSTFTFDEPCPFEEGNCLCSKPHSWTDTDGDDRLEWYYWALEKKIQEKCQATRPLDPARYESDWNNRVLKMAYLDMRPSDYGLNIDSRIRQSHSLTCAPLPIFWFRVPYSYESPGNVTVFWIGYPYGSFNRSEKYTNPRDMIHYYYPLFIRPGPFWVHSAALYELTIYADHVDYQRGWMYENIHPGLKRDDGDMFIVRFKYGLDFFSGTLKYSPSLEDTLNSGLDPPAEAKTGPVTYALGCFEKYQLCFDGTCMGWSNTTGAIGQLSRFLHSNYDNDTASEVLQVHSLLIEATAVRKFVARHNYSPLLIRSMLRESAGVKTIFKNSPKEQWHWEVQSWFEMTLLIAKFDLLASVQGVKSGSPRPPNNDPFSNTSWICDKLLFLDNDPTNINFIGLMATLSGLLVLCLLSVMDEILLSIKRGLVMCRKACRWSEGALQRLWRDFLRDLGLAYNKCFQPAHEFMVAKTNAVFQATSISAGLLAKFLLRFVVRRSSAHQSRHSDYDDEGMPSSASIGLEELN